MAKNDTYVIGCKLPSGLVIRGAGKELKLNGANSSMLINGYGTTEGVPADIWDEFAKDHAQSEVIRNGIIFAVGDLTSARDASSERSQVKTGLEQLEPSKMSTKKDEE